MRIGSIPHINFSSIHAIAAKKPVMDSISQVCKNYSGDTVNFSLATEMYKGHNGIGCCHDAVNNDDKEVAFVTVGKEDCSKISTMQWGYGSLNAISQRIDEFHDVATTQEGNELINKLVQEETEEKQEEQD